MRISLIILTFLAFNAYSFAQSTDGSDSLLIEKINYTEANFDTLINVHEIEIESEKYILEILFYSLNDSVLPTSVSYIDHITNELLDSYTEISHNNQGKIKLEQGDKLLFSEIIDKVVITDSVPKDIFDVYTIWNLKFNKIENSKIHFSSFFGNSDGSVGFFVNYMIGLNGEKLEFYFPDEFD